MIKSPRHDAGTKPALPAGGNYAFIDNANVYRAICRKKWNWMTFLQYLRWEFHVEVAFQFFGYIPENKGLYAALERMGYELVFREVIRDGNGNIKGNIDPWLYAKCFEEMANYQKAVIVAGDGDYQPLLKFLVERQKLKALLTPSKKSTSKLLRGFSKYSVTLGHYRE